MTSSINAGSKRPRELLPLSEEQFRAHSLQLDALEKLSTRVENLYIQITALVFIMPDYIPKILFSIQHKIQIYKNSTLSTNLESKIRHSLSILNKMEFCVIYCGSLFKEINEDAYKLIGTINNLSVLDEESLSSTPLVELVEQIHREFMLLANKLKYLSNHVNKPDLGLSFALKLEKARRKYLPIREMLIRNSLISVDNVPPIPEFFCHLAMYNYKTALLPTVHHLIHDKYSLNLSLAKLAAMPCRTPTEEEAARIEAAYNSIPPGVRGSLEDTGEMDEYHLREIPAGSGEHYKMRAKILRDFLLANPQLYPHPADPRTFPAF